MIGDRELSNYLNYSNGQKKLNEIDINDLNRSILEDAAKNRVDEFLTLISRLYKNGELLILGLNMRECIRMVPSRYKDQKFYSKLFSIEPSKMIQFIPVTFRTREMCEILFDLDFEKYISYIPSKYITSDMASKMYDKNPVGLFKYIPDKYKMKEMCDSVFELNPYDTFTHIPDKFKTQKMCDKVFEHNSVFYFSKIPENFITKSMCDTVFAIDPMATFPYIPIKYRTHDMYKVYFKDYPEHYFSSLPDEFKTQEMCNDYFKLSPSKNFQYVPDEFKTQEMCDIYFKLDPKNNFKYIPERFITLEMSYKFISLHVSDKELSCIPKRFRDESVWERLINFSTGWQIIKEIPEGQLTRKLCELLIVRDPQTVFDYIPDEFIDTKFCILALESIGQRTNIWKLVNRFPEDVFNQDLYNAMYKIDPWKTFACMPDEYKTYDMCLRFSAIDDYTVLKRIPVELLDQRMCDLIFENYQGECIEYIPEQFRTKEMFVDLLQLDVSKYSKYVPKKYYDEEIFEIVAVQLKRILDKKGTIEVVSDLCLEVIKLYPSLFFVLPQYKIEEFIMSDLYLLMEQGGTIEKIAEKYNIGVFVVNNVLEKMKEKDFETYTTIKDILEINQNRYFHNMIGNVNSFGRIILSLGDMKKQFLTPEQKLKFAYLYNKYINCSLEEIYSFNYKKYVSEYSDYINVFFKRILKYNYLFDGEVNFATIPEMKTVQYNNAWLKKYDRNKFFGIKDGVPTIESRYGKNATLLTMEVEERITNLLRESGIPLNDFIVKSSFKEYFNGTLSEYIIKFQEYDKEFADTKGKVKK